METSAAEDRIVAAISEVMTDTDAEAELASIKRHAKERRARDDYLWFELVLSLATWGGSEGDVLATDEELFGRVAYHRLGELRPEQRAAEIENTIQQVSSKYEDRRVHYQNKTAEYIARNVGTIDEMGGLTAATRQFESRDGKEEKIAFLEGTFVGIGDKYARNIGMDLYLPEFRDTVAVDQRIKSITKAVGLSFERYETHQSFYQGAATRMNREPWEVDRLLYNYRDAVKQRL